MRKIFMLGMIMGMLTSATQASGLITHNELADDVFDLDQREQALRQKPSTILPVEEEVKYLHKLAKFELGQYLLQNKGLNGRWISYVILHDPERQDLSTVEYWILQFAPSVIAIRAQFKILQNVLQRNLEDNIKIASIPCGTMDDLLYLDYTNIKNSHLTGIDLDPESLMLAQATAAQRGLTCVNFVHKNPFELDHNQKFNIITCSLELHPDRMIDLYKKLHRALEPGGKLVTSFLTPPPSLSNKSPWINIDFKNLQIQSAVLNDIIGVKRQAFRNEELMRDQLAKAGFDILEIIYDSQGILPTVVAQKR